jgi:hypothetical protein
VRQVAPGATSSPPIEAWNTCSSLKPSAGCISPHKKQPCTARVRAVGSGNRTTKILNP